MDFAYFMTVAHTATAIPVQAGIQLEKLLREADKDFAWLLSHFVGMLIIVWIPACAGMTGGTHGSRPV